MTYPITRPVRTTAPTFAQEPISLAEARQQIGLGEDADQHDAQLMDWISAARQSVEMDAAIVCHTGTYAWKTTYFPCTDWLELPDIRPITSITSIVYVATDGTSTTWSSSQYTLETSAIHQFIRLNYSYSWPVIRGDINGITITFVAGYASPAAVPAMVKNAVKMHVARSYNDRMGMDSANRTTAYERLIELLRERSYS